MEGMLKAVAKWDVRNIKKGEVLLINYFNTEMLAAPITFYGFRGIYRCNDFTLTDGATIPKKTTYFTTPQKYQEEVQFVTCRSGHYKYLVKGETYRVTGVRFLKTKNDKVRLEGQKGWFNLGNNITMATIDEMVRFKIRELKSGMIPPSDIYRNEEFRTIEDNTRTDYECQDNDRENRSVLS